MSSVAATDTPLVTILIPTYNRAEYLDECLYSVLRQDFNDYEVIIRDNASEDETKSVVDKYESLFNVGSNYRYIRNEINVGIDQNEGDGLTTDCRGKYCVILHDDDFFINEKFLSRYAEILESSPKVAYVTSDPLNFDRSTTTVPPKDFIDQHLKDPVNPTETHVDGNDFFLNSLTKYHSLHYSATMFRRDLAIERKWADYGSRDMSLALLLAVNNEIVFLSQPLATYTIHDSPSRGRVGWRVSGLPLDHAVRSHEATLKWVAFAREFLNISRFSLFMWRLKMVICKDGYTIGIFNSQDKSRLTEYMQAVRERNFLHYLLLRWLDPSMIAIDRAKVPEKSFSRIPRIMTIEMRRRTSSLIVAISKRLHDPDFRPTIGQIIRWVITGYKGQVT